MTTLIQLKKIMGYLNQTSICINFEQDTERLKRKRQIAEEEIQKQPMFIDARKVHALDNDIIKRFKKEKIFY